MLIYCLVLVLVSEDGLLCSIWFWVILDVNRMSFHCSCPLLKLVSPEQCFFSTKGPAFHVTANFYIIGFLTGWSYFSMSFDWLAAKVDCDWLLRVQKETLHQNH